ICKFLGGRAALPQEFANQNAGFTSDKNPIEGEVGEVQPASRYDLVRPLASRYAHVGKREEGRILDQHGEVTNHKRTYTPTPLRRCPPCRRALRLGTGGSSAGFDNDRLSRLCASESDTPVNGHVEDRVLDRI